MRKKLLCALLCLACTATLLTGCGKPQNELIEEEITVTIPGMTETHKYVYASDLHIIVENEQVNEAELENVRARNGSFVNREGQVPSDFWKNLPGELNAYKADGYLFGGDMVDYYSDTNITCLKEGFDSLNAPYMYVRADHDYATWFGTLPWEYAVEKHRDVDGAPAVAVWEATDYIVLGVDNTTSQITPDMLEEIKAAFAIGKPIILLTHVPINSLVDNSLDQLSREAWGDRNLSWGKGCYYEPDGNTQQFLDLIYAEDSLVKEILCGHMHFTWDGYVTETVHQHVFSAAYNNYIGVITVSGK